MASGVGVLDCIVSIPILHFPILCSISPNCIFKAVGLGIFLHLFWNEHGSDGSRGNLIEWINSCHLSERDISLFIDMLLSWPNVKHRAQQGKSLDFSTFRAATSSLRIQNKQSEIMLSYRKSSLNAKTHAGKEEREVTLGSVNRKTLK